MSSRRSIIKNSMLFPFYLPLLKPTVLALILDAEEDAVTEESDFCKKLIPVGRIFEE